jgi:hypothetical protein
VLKTYKASEVRLVDPLPGESVRTITDSQVASLSIHPESRQAFIVMRNGLERLALYAQATFAPGESERAMSIHQCDICEAVFETAQGLGRHKTSHGRQTDPVDDPTLIGPGARIESKEFITGFQGGKGKAKR